MPLVAHWKLDDNAPTTNVVDEVGNNDGTVVGGKNSDAMSVAGAGSGTGSALVFDGANDWVDCGDTATFSFDRLDPFSISLWAKIVDPTARQDLIGKQEQITGFAGYNLRISQTDADGKLYFLLQSGAGNKINIRVSNASFAGTWINIVVTYDGSSNASGVVIYSDSAVQAVMVEDDSLTGSILSTTSLELGSAGGGGTLLFDGDLDNVQIYDHALTQAEVDQLYFAGLNQPTPFAAVPSGANAINLTWVD